MESFGGKSKIPLNMDPMTVVQDAQASLDLASKVFQHEDMDSNDGMLKRKCLDLKMTLANLV